MKVFFFFSLFYALLAVLLAYMVRDNVAAVLDFGVTKAVNNIWRFFVYLKLLSLGLVCLLYFTRKFGLRDRIIDAAYAFFGCLVFAGAFSIVKTSIPFLNPFYADTMLADLDQSLHLGWNPWEIVHLASDIVSPQFVETVYFWTWMLPAFFLPVIIALTDFNPERRARFLVLHCSCWILLGNVLALAFSSVGPVYYDLLLSDDRFLDLRQALAATGIADSQLGQSQAYLWYDYENRGQAFGSGISAFPSVHVGVALVVALYAAERSVYLAPFVTCPPSVPRS